MKLDFDLYLKEKYSEIVGEKNIKDGDMEKTKEEQIVNLKKLNKRKNNSNKKWLKRVEEEKLRKQKEIKLVTNTKRKECFNFFRRRDNYRTTGEER